MQHPDPSTASRRKNGVTTRDIDALDGPGNHLVPKVFYDGTCPVCSREIGFYRRHGGDTDIEWVDIDTAPDACFPADLTREAALARFHFVDRSGHVHTGAAAFARLWSEMPRLRWLGRVAQFGPVLFVLERLYGVFLRHRAQRQS